MSLGSKKMKQAKIGAIILLDTNKKPRNGAGILTANLVSSANVLVVDDEKNIRRSLTLCLEDMKFKVRNAENSRQALHLAEKEVFDLAFIDIRLGSENGLELITSILAENPWIKIIVISAYATIESAVEAMNRGAFNYIPKPFSVDQIRLLARKALELRKLEQQIANLEDSFAEKLPPVILTSKCKEMQRILEMAKQAALSEASILITGPSGTGKSILAKAVHDWSNRRSAPFFTISCPSLGAELLENELFGHAKGAFTGAVSEYAGKIAACENGTLFLDEIGDLPLNLQPKLLRFLQDRKYERIGDSHIREADVRIIAATNSDLRQAVAKGAFREDLFYRLNVIELKIPGLAQREEDLLDISELLLKYYSNQNHKRILCFSQEAKAALKNHDWPGNIRELRNCIERAVILCSGNEISINNLNLRSENVFTPKKRLMTLKELEKQHISKTLAESNSIHEAAQVLGIDQATLWRKRKLYHLD